MVHSINKQGSDLQIYPLELLRRFSTVKFAATVRHPASTMHGVQKHKFTNFDILPTVHLNIFILILTNLMH